MSHTHDDRVADRPGHLCAAYGCPLIGAMTASTGGTSEWWCVCHFSKDVGAYQRITSELHRLEWLSKAVTDLRLRTHNPDWRATFERIHHDIQLAQRNDLQWQDTESADAWMVRLEATLDGLIRAECKPAPRQRQAPLPTSDTGTGTFAKVAFEIPEAA